jgi:hypothetical protein
LSKKWGIAVDTDGDGADNAKDLYPTDNTRVINRYVVAPVFSSLSTIANNSLTLWLDAVSQNYFSMDTTGNITKWYDLSGNQAYAYQLTTAAKPLYMPTGLNGKPAVSFDGLAQYFESYASASYPTYSIFVVMKTGASVAGEKGLLTVAQKDKKISIINIEVKSTDELFSKAFTESIAQEVSGYYIEIKSKKARQNMEILQRQTDSIRAELNGAITGVAAAADNTFGLNPAMMVRKTPGTRRQVDVQANTAILTQLVANLEMAKVSLRKETPLIQVIDRPILPLKKEKVGKLKSLILGGFLAGFLTVLVLIFKKLFAGILAD